MSTPNLSVAPAALDSYSGTQQQIARDIAATALRGRGGIAELSLTFGMIGADFLAATAFALDARSRRLETAAARHRTVGTGSASAATAYRGTDDESGTLLAITPAAAGPTLRPGTSPDAELSL
ncbi:hypothetical protein GCM10009624_22100 [Gordonia sinesedis]